MLFLWLCLSAFANSDATLRNYIREFEVAPLSKPAPRREALYRLGARLFSDRQLSGKGNISCLDCHTPRWGTGDALPLGVGEGASGHGMRRRQNGAPLLQRNSPPLYNLGLASASHLFWDGRLSKDEHGFWVTPEPGLNGENPRLEAIARTVDSLLAMQALFPIASPEEMLGRDSLLSREAAWSNVLERLLSGPVAETYRALFSEAFGETELNIGHVANALGEFQRHAFWSADTPWDRYLKGDAAALTDEMKAGALVFFGKGQCASCHNGEQLSAFDFDGVGTPHLGPVGSDDLGRMDVTGLEEDRYKFRVSPLRNIAVTGPYMHNGVFKTLWQVIEFYDAPERSLMEFVWRDIVTGYDSDTALTVDRDPLRQLARLASMAEDLPREIGFTAQEEEELWCFLTVGLTDMSLQVLIKGVEHENPRCPALIPHR